MPRRRDKQEMVNIINKEIIPHIEDSSEKEKESKVRVTRRAGSRACVTLNSTARVILIEIEIFEKRLERGKRIFSFSQRCNYLKKEKKMV